MSIVTDLRLSMIVTVLIAITARQVAHAEEPSANALASPAAFDTWPAPYQQNGMAAESSRNPLQLTAHHMDSGHGDGACSCYVYPTGLTGGAEITLLKVYQSEGSAGTFDYNPAPRMWAGWTTQTGLGARVRWFDYNNSRLGHPGNDDYEIMTVDGELTDNVELTPYLSAVISGGVRYADFQEIVALAVPANGLKNGVGPVLGVELYRYLTPQFSLFTLGRASFLYGDGQSAGVLPLDEHRTASVLEMQLGVQWNRPLANGAVVFGRGAWEGQWWGGISGNDSEHVGLAGGTFSLGVMR